MSTASPGWRRRRDVKTQDREKSLSPLDKDQLKERCLARVRSERRRQMARVRQRRDFAGEALAESSASPDVTMPLELGEEGGSSLSQGGFLSYAKDILRHGLNDIAGEKRQSREHSHPNEQAARLGQDREPSSPHANANGDAQDVTAHHDRGGPLSLMAIEEETAYLNACAPRGQGRRRPSPRRLEGSPAASNVREDSRPGGEEGGGALPQPEAMDGDDVWEENGAFRDEEHMLSPEEYLEMMQYIEEACRQEDLNAEAEAIEEYELNRRLEEEAVESAVASGLDFDDNGQDNSVLCPVCKRNYLLQAGAPSASIVCVCGFRLDTGGDRLGLEHLRQQLAETYEQHRTGCSAEPSFSVEGSPGLDVLWSSCDGCGFARVVL